MDSTETDHEAMLADGKVDAAKATEHTAAVALHAAEEAARALHQKAADEHGQEAEHTPSE